jgi:hypothetical protein
MTIKCPICTLPIFITSSGTAHDLLTVGGYCRECDASTDVTLPQSKINGYVKGGRINVDSRRSFTES